VVADWNRETPWRQGHLLCANAISALSLADTDLAEKTYVIVASHDCDLAQETGSEPFVELIVGHLVEKDGNCTHGKNSRKLHIQFAGEHPIWV
jgi:hypothetical protein